MRSAIRFVGFCFVLFLITTTSWAAAIHVCPDGTGDYLTIQAAIDASFTGDEITLCDGVYAGAGNRDLDFGGRDITLRSANGPAACIIDCQNAGRAFIFQNAETSSAVVQGITVTNGIAVDGGAVLCTDADPQFIDCAFMGNTATGSAGGGGAMFLQSTSVVLDQCVFQGNIASDDGGALIAKGTDSDVQALNCVFADNAANGSDGSAFGGAAFISQASNLATFVNCAFLRNSIASTSNSGGSAVVATGGSAVLLINCTVRDNLGSGGASVQERTTATVTVVNSILWGNTPIQLIGPATYSCIEGGAAGLGNISTDPLFADPAGRLLASSPCIDAGDNGAVPIGITTDLDGNDRFADVSSIVDSGVGTAPIVDMGAYEVQASPQTLSVCPDGTGDYLTIQAAIDASVAGDEVVLCDGTYTGVGNRDLDFGGRDITLRSANGPAACIIDCQNAGRAFIFQNAETSSAVVRGITVTNGIAVDGGAVLCTDADPQFIDCVFTGNTATGSAGGGGAMFLQNTSVVLERCVFEGNIASDDGGALIVKGTDSDVQALNCVFADNAANGSDGSAFGGAAFVSQASNLATFVNCAFLRNSIASTSNSGGSAVVATGGSAVLLVNCTVRDNLGSGGASVQERTTATVTVVNSILWGNTPIQLIGPATYSCIEGGAAGLGNISTDPLFADPAGRLLASSPCIDAGDNGAVPPGITTDLDGNARFYDIVLAADTGSGIAPIVDIGAYELFDDCNGNSVPDDWDLAAGTSQDCDSNGIPDECEPDCDGDGTPDACDLDNSILGDTDGDGDVDLTDLANVLGNFGRICLQP